MIIDAGEFALIVLAYCLLLWNLLRFIPSFRLIFIIVQVLEILLWNLRRRLQYPCVLDICIFRRIQGCASHDISDALIMQLAISNRAYQSVFEEKSLDGLTREVKTTADLIDYSHRLWSTVRIVRLDSRSKLPHAMKIYEFSIQVLLEHFSNVELFSSIQYFMECTKNDWDPSWFQEILVKCECVDIRIS